MLTSKGRSLQIVNLNSNAKLYVYILVHIEILCYTVYLYIVKLELGLTARYYVMLN